MPPTSPSSSFATISGTGPAPPVTFRRLWRTAARTPSGTRSAPTPAGSGSTPRRDGPASDARLGAPQAVRRTSGASRPGRAVLAAGDQDLLLLPEENGRGYGVGYGGRGPHELARYINQLIDSDGRNTSAASLRPRDSRPDQEVLAWVSSKEATGRHKLSLDNLKRIRRS